MVIEGAFVFIGIAMLAAVESSTSASETCKVWRVVNAMVVKKGVKKKI